MLRIRFALEPRQEQLVQTGETAPAGDSADVKNKAPSQLLNQNSEGEESLNEPETLDVSKEQGDALKYSLLYSCCAHGQTSAVETFR